jgi:hypothetical protein
VPPVVVRVRRVRREVVTVHVVDVAVQVVVDPVPGNLALVHPDAPRELRVVGPDPRVEHGHDDVLIARRDGPRVGGFDVGADHAREAGGVHGLIPRVPKTPLVSDEVGIVGERRGGRAGRRGLGRQVVGLRVLHLGDGEGLGRLRDVESAGGVQENVLLQAGAGGGLAAARPL